MASPDQQRGDTISRPRKDLHVLATCDAVPWLLTLSQYGFAHPYAGTTMLQDKILALIASQPGISRGELREAFRWAPPQTLERVIRALQQAGRVEHVDHGRLRVVQPENSEPTTHQLSVDARMIAPPNLARLMAGR
jgi:hypothetical protein